MKLVFTVLAIVYALSPFDLLPEGFLPILGWLDDLVVFWLLWRAFYSGARNRPGGSAGQSAEGRGTGAGAGASGGPHRGARQSDALKNPYAVLDISPDASKEEIKSAYRRLAAKYHPDKVAHLGDEFREMAEVRFKEIQEAYQELVK